MFNCFLLRHEPGLDDQDVRKALELWKEDYAVTGRASTPGARSFKSHSKEFLRRTQVFLAAPGNSQPGRCVHPPG